MQGGEGGKDATQINWAVFSKWCGNGTARWIARPCQLALAPPHLVPGDGAGCRTNRGAVAAPRHGDVHIERLCVASASGGIARTPNTAAVGRARPLAATKQYRGMRGRAGQATGSLAPAPYGPPTMWAQMLPPRGYGPRGVWEKALGVQGHCRARKARRALTAAKWPRAVAVLASGGHVQLAA